VKNSKNSKYFFIAAFVLVVLDIYTAFHVRLDSNNPDKKVLVAETAGLIIAFGLFLAGLFTMSRLTQSKPDLLSRFVKRHAFLITFFFGSLIIKGEFSLSLTGKSIIIGFLMDLLRKSIKPKQLSK
jgi:hypothetical protein